MGLSSELSCEAGSFSHFRTPHRLQQEVLRLSFPMPEPWVAPFVWLSCCSSWFIHMQMWHHQMLPCPAPSLPWLPTLSLLTVWMNVSSLSPWSWDFHTVQFSVNSGWFLFLNFLLSFFWLCEEASCIYRCLHLGQRPDSWII